MDVFRESSSSLCSSVSSDKEELFFNHSVEFIKNRKNGLISSKKCETCWLTLPLCICSRVSQIFSELHASPKANIRLYMHYKEWGRASNTGKLLQMGYPQSTTTYLFGVKEDQDKIVEDLIGPGAGPSIILCPSPRALKIQDFVDLYRQSDRMNVCVLDSTWPQSFAMDQSLPESIPRVRIDDFVTEASLFLNRKQSDNRTKISTLEAVVLCLQALGEKTEVLDPLLESLKIGVDALLTQSGKKIAYGNNFESQITGVLNKYGSIGKYTQQSVERPLNCPHCSASREFTVFKNLGLRDPLKDEACQASTCSADDSNSNRQLNREKSARHYRLWLCRACNNTFKQS